LANKIALLDSKIQEKEFNCGKLGLKRNELMMKSEEIGIKKYE